MTLNYTSKTDEEIAEIATGILAGSIYTDRHARSPDELGSVFMVIALASDEARKEILGFLTNPETGEAEGMIYEHMAKASPTAVNGLPCFMSLQYADPADTKRIMECANRMREAATDGD